MPPDGMPPDGMPARPVGRSDRSVATRSGGSLPAVLIASISIVGLVGCGSEAAYEKAEPYELTATAEGVNEVALTPKASERLRMEAAPVTLAEGGGDLLTVPYAALIYDFNGGTWIYQQIDPLSYKRVQVVVDHIEGDTVYLTEAPEVGTPVAVTSVAELYGADTGVGK